MIHFHGTPLGMDAENGARMLSGRHALVPFPAPSALSYVREVCQSYCVDNGSFSAWASGTPITDWLPYYRWVESLDGPLDFAIIPDVIDGAEKENDALVKSWPLGFLGAPVWHLHESLARLSWLVREWPLVCLGSSGEFSQPGSEGWWSRMAEAMSVACNESGIPRTKLHGLRMLDPAIFSRLPLYSADSTNAGRNAGNPTQWRGTHVPPDKAWRGSVIAARTEAHQAAPRWIPSPQLTLGVG
ncbi:MAG: hypothetical protein IPO00_08760 [Betaproteobacteria bacterium]|nr:hypothetical protein [Betaproteobacteria bacterium]